MKKKLKSNQSLNLRKRYWLGTYVLVKDLAPAVALPSYHPPGRDVRVQDNVDDGGGAFPVRVAPVGRPGQDEGVRAVRVKEGRGGGAGDGRAGGSGQLTLARLCGDREGAKDTAMKNWRTVKARSLDRASNFIYLFILIN